MAVALRLMRFGKKGQASYRVVVLDKRSKRDGAYVEKIGMYDPMVNPAKLELNEERLSYWLKVGAVVSEGMRKLLKSRQPKVVKPAKAVKTTKAATAEKPAAAAKTVKKTPAKKTTKAAAK